jgi:signal transduction histidine kinase
MMSLDDLIKETLVFVAQKGWTQSHEGFFAALVTFLGEKLELEYALVDELLPDQKRARTVGLYAAGKVVPDIEYELRGTPCENVMGRTLCCYPRGIQELFPEDQMLRQMAAESYVGIPLWDSQGSPIGLIAVMGQKPILDRELVEPILQIVAVRCAHELERKRSEEERRRAEQEIRRLNLELERRVVDRTAQLVAANEELEAFVYAVSHDLQAPLRHIGGFIDLLQKRAGASLDPQVLHYSDVIADASRRMATLIDHLLTVSRTGRAELVRTAVDVGALVREVVAELGPETKGRTIDWIMGDLPRVNADRQLLRLALANLISNALKFTRTRSRAEIEVGCTASRGDDEVVLFVRDNGVGFDMKYAGKLFQVFQRLHPAAEFEGTGLGLANVRRVVKRHGGRTWAEGAPGEGATFFLSLPVREGRPGRAGPEPVFGMPG